MSSQFNQAVAAIKNLDSRFSHLQATGEMTASKLWYKWDYFCCMLAYGAAPNDYIFFRMFKKNRKERRALVTFKKHVRINKILNDYQVDTSIIGNKAKFNAYLGPYIKRDWIWSRDANLNQLLAFLDAHGTAFFKPVTATKGEGIRCLHAERVDDRDFLIQAFQDGDFLLEEQIKQSEAIAKINPYAVNSMRMTTILSKDGKRAQVLCASLKVSCDKSCVDNLSSGGQVYPVDLETGIISLPGLSYADDDWHVVHPVTGQIVVGTKVDNMAEIRETLETLAKKFPDFRYLGWDVAITEDGFDIIEANTSPGSRLLQCDGQGRYLAIKKYL